MNLTHSGMAMESADPFLASEKADLVNGMWKGWLLVDQRTQNPGLELAVVPNKDSALGRCEWIPRLHGLTRGYPETHLTYFPDRLKW